MPAGELIAAYAFEVVPKQSSAFTGGIVDVVPALQGALDSAFDRSRVESAPVVTFQVDNSSPTRTHVIRTTAMSIAFAPTPVPAIAEQLAARFAGAMDNRSKGSLFMVSVHEAISESSRRLLLWTFPQQQVFNLTVSGGHTRLELLEAFNRESSLRKVALLEGPNLPTGMLTARVLDFQSTAAERAVADLWIVKFLESRLQMSDTEGTQLLARALRVAHTKTRNDADAQDQVAAAISGLRSTTVTRWSINTVASTYLSGEAATAFLNAVRPEERGALFGVDKGRLDQMIQYTRFTLDNGIVVSAPFVQIGADGGVTVTEVNGKRRLSAVGEIEEESVRTRA